MKPTTSTFLDLSWERFVQEWFLGSVPQLTPEEVQRGLDALGHWVPTRMSSLAAGSQRGPAIVEPTVRFGLRVAQTAALRGFSDLASRLQHEEAGAHLELLLAAALVSLGYQPELEPEVDPDAKQNGKRNDAAINVDGRRVHFEATFAAQSDEGARAQSVAQQLAKALVEQQDSGHILIWTTLPLQCEMIGPIMQECESAERDVLVEMPGIGYLRKTNSDDPSGPEPPDIGPRWVVVQGKIENGVNRVVNIRQPAIDLRLPNLMHKKSAQMGTNTNIVVIGVGNIPGKMGELAPLIARRFQPALNRRFGAAVLVRSAFHGDGLVSRTEWEVVPNPYATDPVPDGLLSQIASLNGKPL
jgi:hypothetical protein